VPYAIKKGVLEGIVDLCTLLDQLQLRCW
jgi:hypothetical protein